MKKLVSILLTLAVAVSLLVIPAVVSAADPGIVLNAEGTATAVWSDVDPKSGSYSVLLTAENPNSASVVVIPVNVSLGGITELSYWYNSESYVSGTGTIVGPDMVLVLVDIEGQHIVGTGGAEDSDGEWWKADAVTGDNIATASVNPDEIWWGVTESRVTFAELKDAFSDATVVGVGVNLEPPSVDGSGSVYVDDITIGTVIYDLEPTTAAVGLTAETPEITAISVTPGIINFGTVKPGDNPSGPNITVKNIGTVTVKVDASLSTSGTVFDYLKLNSAGAGSWSPIISSMLPSGSESLTTQLVVPETYSAKGVETATLVFEAEVA